MQTQRNKRNYKEKTILARIVRWSHSQLENEGIFSWIVHKWKLVG